MENKTNLDSWFLHRSSGNPIYYTGTYGANDLKEFLTQLEENYRKNELEYFNWNSFPNEFEYFNWNIFPKWNYKNIKII